MTIAWPEFAALVRKHEAFILTSHMRPDCDALGSELAMAEILKAIGKKVTIVNGDTVPQHIAFIDPNQDVKTLGSTFEFEETSNYDALMVLDTSAWVQLGPMDEVVRNFSGTKLVLDHHVSGDDLGAVDFKDTSAEATGRLVVDAAEALDVPLTLEIAVPLFCAIATDTGWFRFSSVSDKTFSAIAKLVAAGARPNLIFSDLYESSSLARLHLQGRILASVELMENGTLAHSTAALSDFNETGAEPTDTEDVVNRMFTIGSVQTALLFVEISKDKTKVSLRSRGKLDVSAVAEQFNGGGHTAAAGITFNGPLENAKKEILDAVIRFKG